MNDPAEDDATARNRVFVLGLIRLSGIVMIAIGILVANGTVEWPKLIGYGLIAVGVTELLVIPQILVRRWRSDKE